MTSQNTNTKINISTENVYGDCDLKCSYNYKYTQSNLIAKNNGNFISFSHDKGTTSPVIYNTLNYNVSKINIYSPSLHTFNNNTVNAEFVIEHAPVIGGEMLYVCIPIIASTNSSEASNILTEIIKSVANSAPAVNESTNLNISNFNLNTFVPKKPFFAYTGTQGLTGQVIVFGNNYAIPLNQQTLNILSKVIKPYPITISGGSLFLNRKGPNSVQNNGNNGIYISCQPTGSSKEETDVTNNKNPVNYNMETVFNDPTVILIIQVIVGCVVFILIFLMLNYGYNYAISGTSPSLKMPTMGSLKTFYK
jgi:hypothetical protein